MAEVQIETMTDKAIADEAEARAKEMSTTDPLDLAAIRARHDAARGTGSQGASLADIPRLLDEIKTLTETNKAGYAQWERQCDEMNALIAERDTARKERDGLAAAVRVIPPPPLIDNCHCYECMKGRKAKWQAAQDLAAKYAKVKP